jgi:hypothetical protein
MRRHPDDDRAEPAVLVAELENTPATRSTASASLATAIVSSGRASVHDTSLIARPTRRARRRPPGPVHPSRKCYNFALPNIL